MVWLSMANNSIWLLALASFSLGLLLQVTLHLGLELQPLHLLCSTKAHNNIHELYVIPGTQQRSSILHGTENPEGYTAATAA